MRHCLMLLFCLSACGPSTNPRLLYAPETTFEVDELDTSLTYTPADTVTPERTLQLRLRTPRGATGPLPAVVVVHGGGFNTAGFRTLTDWGEQLARAGYVAIHFGNAEDEPTSHCAPLQIPASECTEAFLTKEVSEGGTLIAPMYTRPRDVKAILDALATLEQRAGVTIDRDRLGVLGHSAGSHATMSLAGLRVDLAPSVKGVVWADEPRLKAFVANSPQGVGRMGVTEGSWAGITRPVLIQTGSGDQTEGEQAKSRRDAFRALAGNAWEHFLDDPTARHSQFALEQDEGVTGNELALARTALAFFDAQLRGREAAREWLAGNALTRATGGVSTLSRK